MKKNKKYKITKYYNRTQYNNLLNEYTYTFMRKIWKKKL